MENKQTEAQRLDQRFEEGHAAGKEAAAILLGVIYGFADYFNESAVETGVEFVGEDDAPGEEKTAIGDCRACWCDSCADIETCDVCMLEDPENGDPLRPVPCRGCLNGVRHMPTEHEPACGKYAEGDGPNNG